MRPQFYMALPGTVSADDLKSPLEEPKQIAPQAALFSLASLEHSSAHFRQASAQRENASISACLSQALATSSQARAHTSQSGYAYFEPRSKQLSSQRRDPCAVACCRNRGCDDVHIGLCERLLSTHNGVDDVISFKTIAKFWRPHRQLNARLIIPVAGLIDHMRLGVFVLLSAMILKFKDRLSRKQDFNGIFTGGSMTADDSWENYAKVTPESLPH